MVLFERIKSFITSGDSRTKSVKVNSLFMLLLKGASTLISLILVPLTIGYVSSETYGIWLTISSIVAWVSLFDIGLNNGLRNKFAECKATGEMYKAKQYVSTTYALLSLIFIPLSIVLIIVNQFLDWNNILNVSVLEDIRSAVDVLVIYFCSNFILTTINVVVTADMRPAVASVINVLQQLATLAMVLLFMKTIQGSLLVLCLALCLPPLIVVLLGNLYYFKGRYRSVAPSISSIDFSLTKDLLTLGYKFFVIQIAVIVLFQTSNFIMVRYYGPDSVTQYNISYRYFFVLQTLFGIVVTPLWSAVTDALSKGNVEWIQRIIKKYTYLGIAFMFIGLIMLLVSGTVYKIWIGDKVSEIPFILSMLVYFYVCESMMANLYATILNGAGYLRLQFIFCCASPFIFIGLCYLFIFVFNFGVFCIPLAIILANFYGLCISPFQCYTVFYKGKKGVWVK